jgi:uncharacterized membrane protein YkgB
MLYNFNTKLSSDNTHIKLVTVPFSGGKKKQKIYARITMWNSCNALTCLRISLGIIYFWFGILKFFPGLSPAETLAAKTISHLSVDYIPSFISLPLLAIWECAIGIGFIISRSMRTVLLLFFLQIPGTFLPLIFFPHETWTKLFVPTLEGQYIIKNIVLISSGLVVGAAIRKSDLGSNMKHAEKSKEEYNLLQEECLK